MTICGILGTTEIILIGLVVIIFLFPAIRMLSDRKKQSQYTEKLDQLERLERLHRDGTLSERQFERQKRRLLNKRG
ncbi:MAG: SHOCT domain-containing protein [Bacteroidota bacterium]